MALEMAFPFEEEGCGAGIGLLCLVEEGVRLWQVPLPSTTRSVGVCEGGGSSALP
jgi:hypothetical protein